MTSATEAIEFKKVSSKERALFPIKHFDNPLFDTLIFKVANVIVKDYSGGYWNYIETTVSGSVIPFFELESHDDLIVLRNPYSGDEFSFDSKLGGIIVTLYTVGLALETTQIQSVFERLIAVYDGLRNLAYEYALQVNKSEEAFGMID